LYDGTIGKFYIVAVAMISGG